jgi:hypothetical protein
MLQNRDELGFWQARQLPFGLSLLGWNLSRPSCPRLAFVRRSTWKFAQSRPISFNFGSMDQERVLNLVVHGVAPRATP